MDKNWHVYILRCADDTFYTGITNDPPRRLAQHNAGTASRCTRSRRPVEMVYCSQVADKSAALRREATIKKLTHLQKQQLITGSKN